MRKIIAAAALTVTAAIAATTGYTLHPSGPRACSSPSLPSGDSISIDAQGNASSPATGGQEFTCADGSWVRITGYGSAALAVTTAYSQPESTTPAGGWFTQDDATCSAFKAYLRHRTPRRFAVLVKDSATAFWFLRMDVAWWAKDRKQHADRAELAQDAVMVAGDCSDPAAQQDS